MSRVPQYMHRVAEWEVANTGLISNSTELPHLELHRSELEKKLLQFKELGAQRAVLTTSKQEVGKKMRGLFREVETLLNFLRTGVRQHYGKDSEKLIEFGLQPYRSRKSALKSSAAEDTEPSEQTAAA